MFGRTKKPQTRTHDRRDRFEVYAARDGYRWRLRDENGLVLAAATQGYSRKADCVDNLNRVTGAAVGAGVVDLTRGK